MWGHHSSKTRPSLTKPPSIGSPESKDCRVVKPGNRVCKLNFCLELALYMGLSRPKTMSELTKPPCINTTGKKKTLNYFPTKKNTFDVLLLKYLVLIWKTTLSLQEPFICGLIFSNCPIVSVVQTAWIVNCG